jgi:hypothetical protein
MVGAVRWDQGTIVDSSIMGPLAILEITSAKEACGSTPTQLPVSIGHYGHVLCAVLGTGAESITFRAFSRDPVN